MRARDGRACAHDGRGCTHATLTTARLVRISRLGCASGSAVSVRNVSRRPFVPLTRLVRAVDQFGRPTRTTANHGRAWQCGPAVRSPRPSPARRADVSARHCPDSHRAGARATLAVRSLASAVVGRKIGHWLAGTPARRTSVPMRVRATHATLTTARLVRISPPREASRERAERERRVATAVCPANATGTSGRPVCVVAGCGAGANAPARLRCG